MSSAMALKRTQKLQLMLDLDELQAIDDWRFANRMPSRSAAVRSLLHRGLEAGDSGQVSRVN